jgi:uncharacterized protein
MSSESYHEPLELISEKTRNMHRAIASLMEELEAVDWYGQRAQACSDDELRGILLHNRSEEIEHASMVLEWIRRHEPTFDGNIQTYVNKTKPILEIEREKSTQGPSGSSGSSDSAGGASSRSLGIGSLRAGS